MKKETPAAVANEPRQINFKKDKDCKHSIRFAAVDENAPIQSLYVNRVLAGTWSVAEITVSGS